MVSRMTRIYPLLALLLLATAAGRAQESDPPLPQKPDVHYVHTPFEIVDAMLVVAEVGEDDVVYDLGSGDGRIVIAAARDYGARGVGIDIDPGRVRLARLNAGWNEVADRVTFLLGDMFEADISEATVVTLYLLEELNVRLRPKLLEELRPGTRIVSYNFPMGEWKPEKVLPLQDATIYYWTVP